MADNVDITPGTGKTIAADDIGPGVWHQRVKVSLGADGSATDLLGDATLGAYVQLFGGRSPVWKSYNATVAKTGEAIWTPASGKKIVVTSIQIGSYGTTAGRCIVWFGASADTTFNEGTDQPLVKASFAPAAGTKPGLVQNWVVNPPTGAADYILRLTSDAAVSVDIVVYGYEIS